MNVSAESKLCVETLAPNKADFCLPPQSEAIFDFSRHCCSQKEFQPERFPFSSKAAAGALLSAATPAERHKGCSIAEGFHHTPQILGVLQ